MFGDILNFFCRCWHRKTTLPFRRAEIPAGDAEDMYVVCLECGRHLTYDLVSGRIGKPVPGSHQPGQVLTIAQFPASGQPVPVGIADVSNGSSRLRAGFNDSQ